MRTMQDGIGGFAEKDGSIFLGISAHFFDMICIIAADAINSADGKEQGCAVGFLYARNARHVRRVYKILHGASSSLLL